MRYPQVKGLESAAQFVERCDELGIELPLAPEDAPADVLGGPVEVAGSEADSLQLPNRFAILPMEGWDATADGRPTDLVRRRWRRFGGSGAGLVWAEATAVRPDGRANPHQLLLDESTVSEFAELRALLAHEQVAGLQLTHSGRWSRPEGEAAPRTAYQHPLLDRRVGADASSVLRTEDLDELAEAYIAAAVLAHQAGFDFVDVKHCHGYLLHELLSAHDRSDGYGGDLQGRTAFLRAVVEGIRSRAPGLAIAVRLSVFDMAPFVEGPDRTGVAESSGSYRHAFGGDGTGVGIDLAEPHELLHEFAAMGIGLVCTTAGSPYYNPHVQRPAYFPPSDGYRPPEDPLVGVARQLAATAELRAAHPELCLVGSGYTYLQQWLPTGRSRRGRAGRRGRGRPGAHGVVGSGPAGAGARR